MPPRREAIMISAPAWASDELGVGPPSGGLRGGRHIGGGIWSTNFVGMRPDLLVHHRDSQRVVLNRQISEEDPWFQGIRQSWLAALREALQSIQHPDGG